MFRKIELKYRLRGFMFCKKFKYTFIALTVLTITGCSQRTIIIHPEDRRASSLPRVESTIKREPTVREEILIHKNPNLGEQVVVPTNNPSLGTVISSEDDHNKNIDGEMDQADMEGTAVRNTIIPRIAFPVQEYTHLRKRGRSTVSGVIFLEKKGTSQKIVGKKVKLYLNPVTSYSQQWYEESYLNGYKLGKTDKRIYNYLKFTMSNESGIYNFFGVPKGEYFLVGTIKCGVECGFDKEKSIRLVEKVSIGTGITKVNLIKNIH